MMQKLIVFVGLLLFACVNAQARLAAFHFEAMVSNSYMIVVAKVDSITPDSDAPTNAIVRVLETWKGPEHETITLSTAPTWTCDISNAKKGETILLFVWCNQRSGALSINYSGRGRMPIDEINGRKYAIFWPEVWLPKRIRVTEGPQPEFDFIQRADLEDLKKLVDELTKKAPNNALENIGANAPNPQR